MCFKFLKSLLSSSTGSESSPRSALADSCSTNLKKSTPRQMNWKTRLIALVLVGSTLTQIGCSPERPVSWYTGQDYILLKKGQTYQADRDMALATESVVQAKDQQILDLLRACRDLQRRLDLVDSK